MGDFWLRKSETQKIVETIDSITKMYSDYVAGVSKEFFGVNLLDSFSEDDNDKEKGRGHGLNPLDLLTDFGKTVNSYNQMFDGLFKNMKTSLFLNYFNYTINIGNVLSEAKKNPLIPNYQIDILKNMYMNTTIDYVVDYLVQSSVQDFKLNDGSINDDIVDIVLNNVTKLTKISYNFLPDIYDEMLTKVIPGNFVASLLTYQDDRTEFEKAVDMLIHLTPVTPVNFKSPIIDDPFLGVFSILAPKQKKEKTIVETLGNAISKLDISGYSKVKASEILLNRASDAYEKQKNVAGNFLQSLIDSIPVKDEGVKKEKTQVTQNQDGEKIPDSSSQETLKGNKKQSAQQKSNQSVNGKQSKSPTKSDNIKKPVKEIEQGEDILASIAGQILNGEWVNFDLIEKEIYKFFE